MNTILGGNDTNRLVEVLAGSTALLSDTTGADTGPVLNSLLADNSIDVSPDVVAGNDVAPFLAPLDQLNSLLGDLPGPADAPVGGAGDLLGLADVLNLGTTSQLDLAGPDGAVQPVFDATNVLVKDFHAQLETLSHETGTSEIVHGVTNLGETIGLGNTGVVPPAADGHTNLITDVVNAPGTLLGGGGLGALISEVGGDLGDTVHATTGLLDAVLQGTDPINPIPGIIDGLGTDLQTLPLLNINGGTSAGDGGLLGGGALGDGLLNGVVGDLHGSSTGHLIDIDAGPQSTGGLGLDLLATPGTDATHTASINAIDVGPTGPHLLDLGVLTGAGAGSAPGLGGVGLDGLVGHLSGVGGGLAIGEVLSGNTASAPVTAPVSAPLDLEIVHDVTAAVGGDHGVLDLHGTPII